MIEEVEDTRAMLRVQTAEGEILWVPKDEDNADYARIEAWVSEGGTITQPE